jgi:hypothetical protein
MDKKWVFIEIIFVDRRDAKCSTIAIIGKIIGLLFIGCWKVCKFRRKFIDCSILYSEFADFPTANKQQADDFSDDDDCREFCIPPIDKNNFDKTHFLSMKFKYF